MENETKVMNTEELTKAVGLLLEKEEARVALQRRRDRRRVRRRRLEKEASIGQLAHSIEVIKWCIVGIATVMAVSLLILVAVVWRIGNEAERIQGEVQQIKEEAQTIVEKIELKADMIRDKIQHPMQTIGGALGGQLEKRIGSALGLE